MSHWNHRVVKRTFVPKGHPELAETTFAIHEAYYGLEGNEGIAITSDPTDVVSDSVEGLREVLQWMLNSLDKPVLDYDTRKEIISQ